MTTGTGSGIQDRNPAQIDILAADFQARDEPNFAWKSVCSQFLAVPGSRGFWPMSSFDDGGDAYDLSGQGRTLTYNGDPEYNYDALAPYIDFDGTGDYLSRADEAGLDILGTETYVTAAARGLTMWGWGWFDNVAAGTEYFMAKHNGVGQRAYYIRRTAGGSVQFIVSVDGTAESSTVSGVVDVADWLFMVGRFDPGVDVELFINGTWYSAGAGPAAIANSNADFVIGARHGGNSPMDGRASLCGLSTMYVSNAIVGQLWEWSRAMFGR